MAEPEAGAGRAGQRMVMFDAMRLLAAAGVVWIHAVESEMLDPVREAGRFAVSFFVMSSVFFLMEGAGRDERRSYGIYAWYRIRRVYLPFLAWSAAYIVLRDAKHLLLSDHRPVELSAAMLWVGPTQHLWFLPFILAVGLVLFPVARLMVWHPRLLAPVATVAAVGGLVMALLPRPAELAHQSGTNLGGLCYLLGHAWHYTPAVLWGVAVAAMYRSGAKAWLGTAGVAMAGVLLALGSTAWLCLFGRTCLVETMAGARCVLVALAPWQGAWLERIAPLGGVAFGVYLSHIVFVEGFQAVAGRKGWHAMWWLDVAVFVLALGCSACLALSLRRRRGTRWLVQ